MNSRFVLVMFLLGYCCTLGFTFAALATWILTG